MDVKIEEIEDPEALERVENCLAERDRRRALNMLLAALSPGQEKGIRHAYGLADNPALVDVSPDLNTDRTLRRLRILALELFFLPHEISQRIRYQTTRPDMYN